MGSLLDFALPCWLLATLPKERGPVETVPGRKAETDRVREGISEGFRPAQSGRVAPRGREPMGGRAVRAMLDRRDMRFGGAERGRTAASQFCRLLP